MKFLFSNTPIKVMFFVFKIDYQAVDFYTDSSRLQFGNLHDGKVHQLDRVKLKQSKPGERALLASLKIPDLNCLPSLQRLT